MKRAAALKRFVHCFNIVQACSFYYYLFFVLFSQAEAKPPKRSTNKKQRSSVKRRRSSDVTFDAVCDGAFARAISVITPELISRFSTKWRGLPWSTEQDGCC
jgi:hypothetical protein